MPFDGQTRWQIDILAADKTAQAFATVDRRLKSLETGLSGMSRTMAAGLGQTVALGRGLQAAAISYGLAAAAHKAFQTGLMIGDLGEQAEQLGVNTDQLQAYRLVAAQAGVSTEQLDAAILKLQRAMGTANDGSDEMIARFDKLGVKILAADGTLRPVADILPEVARGMLKVESETQKTAMMTELFGKSGARLKTMLEEWAQGNERMVASAKKQNAVVGPDAIRAWDGLGDALKTADVRYQALVGTFGKPVALAGLEAINIALANMNGAIINIRNGWSWLSRTADQLNGSNFSGMQKEAADIQSRIDKLHAKPRTTLGEAELQREYARLGMLQQKISDAMTTGYVPTMAEITVTANKDDNHNPLGDLARKAGAKLDERLKDLQVERAALEKALAAFDVRGLETMAEVEKRLDAQAKLDQKIASILKDVPPNSPLAQQLIQEATAISQLNTRLDERKRLLTEAEQVISQYGDGSRAAARATADLNAMLAAGAIDADTYARAMKATKDAAADQERAARGAKGGFDGFMAGVEQYGAEMQKANSAFEMGKFTAQEFGSVFSGVNQGLREGKDLWTAFGDAGVNALGRIADKLIDMAVQDLIGAAFGKGGGGGGILNLFGGGSSGTSGGLFDGIMGLFNFFPTFADGGNYQAGVPRIVGEKGWELDVPRSSGTIYNQRQLASLLGGGGGSGGIQRLQVSISLDSNMLRAVVRDESGQVVARAAPKIENRAVRRANDSAPAAVERANAQGGGDWRFSRD